MNIDTMFSEEDRNRIRAAVDEAEHLTSGEIVPFVVDRSDDYEAAEWRCGAAVAAIALLSLVVLHTLPTVWLPVDITWAVTAAAAGAFAGIGLVRLLPPVLRFCAGKRALDRSVALRAAQAFLDEEIFRTRERTGILIFVSVLEHRVLVLGDSGINALVRQEEWSDIVGTVVDGIRRGAAADGLVKAIGECGTLLKRAGLVIKKDDTNELRDDLRIRPSRSRKPRRKKK